MTRDTPMVAPAAPPLQVDHWLNTREPLDLPKLQGKVVLICAFQMLCPGCVIHGLPQAEKARRTFMSGDFVVIGLHTVFEHHEVMGLEALRVFAQEYRWSFPIGVDRADESGGVPLTMRAYGLQGTPSVVLIDRHGRIRLRHFGQIDDMALGGTIGRLLVEPAVLARSADDSASTEEAPSSGCESGVCSAT
jgi:hypothetical protein